MKSKRDDRAVGAATRLLRWDPVVGVGFDPGLPQSRRPVSFPSPSFAVSRSLVTRVMASLRSLRRQLGGRRLGRGTRASLWRYKNRR